MKLEDLRRAGCDHRIEQCIVRVDQHGDAADMAGHARREIGQLRGRQVARAFGEMDKADMARAAGEGSIDGVNGADAANLDSDSGHGARCSPYRPMRGGWTGNAASSLACASNRSRAASISSR